MLQTFWTPVIKEKISTPRTGTPGLDYIYKLPSNFNAEIQIDELFKNIAEYRSGDGFFALEFVKSSQKNPQLTPLNFGKGICTDLPLSKVAEAVQQCHLRQL